jgi:dinuclear metal center YbgI/SA1388 family protein
MKGEATVRDVVGWLESWIPPLLAEDWDNVGLLLGDPSDPLQVVLTTLDVTAEVADEAIAAGAGLIVSHHPILFRGTKRLTGGSADPNAHIWRLARAGVAVYSPHTAYDSAEGGINDQLASRLGLLDVRPLRPGPASRRCKVVTFATDADREVVLRAAFDAGGGTIGDYSECSFSTQGRGTFRGGETTNPTVGQKQRRESVDEWKVEVICDEDRAQVVAAAIRQAHSYEEPAVDVIPLALLPGKAGSGRVGRLKHPTTLAKLARFVADDLQAPATTWAGPGPAHPVATVAIACGAGDDFLADAARAGADVLLTGEARYHRCLEAEARQMGLILAGHHATEWVGVVGLRARIAAAFPQLVVQTSQTQTVGPRPI